MSKLNFWLKLILVVLLFGQSDRICAQISIPTTYELKTGREAAIITAGAIPMGFSIMLTKRKPILSVESIEALDASGIWGIDRWVTKNYSRTAHRMSNGLLFSSFALPLALLADQPGRDEFGKVALMSFEGLLVANGIGNLTKHLVRRVRPYVYNPEVPMQEKLQANSDLSFFSGHTYNVSYMYYLTAALYDDFHSSSKARPFVWTTAAIVPAIQGYLRVRAGKHFVTDVVVGYLVGAAVGLVIPSLHTF